MTPRPPSRPVRHAVVPDADRDLVRETTLRLLREAGAEVPEATHTHVRFHGWDAKGEFSFARAGYIGLHGHAGETELDLRVIARAAAPRRAFVLASAVALVAAVLLFALQPTPGVWVLAAVVLWPTWIAAAVVALGARRVDRELEDRLYASLVEALRAEGQTVLTEAEVRRRDFEAETEGEVAARRLKAAQGKR